MMTKMSRISPPPATHDTMMMRRVGRVLGVGVATGGMGRVLGVGMATRGTGSKETQ